MNDPPNPTKLVVSAEQSELQRNVENISNPPDEINMAYRKRKSKLDWKSCAVAGTNSPKTTENKINTGSVFQAFVCNI